MLAAFFCTLALAVDAGAIDYASTSQLASGKWVKVSVTETGMYFINNQQLTRMGFSNPQDVYVYGYGGNRLSDYLDPATYIDDLPATPVIRTSTGILFFAKGVKTRSTDVRGYQLLKSNPFSSYGYYFLSDVKGLDVDDIPTVELQGTTPDTWSTTFTEVVNHELDAYSPGETGHFLVGEDLKYTPSRTFGFELPGNSGKEVTVVASVMTNLTGGAAWTIEAAGVTKDVAAPATSTSNYVHGDITSTIIEVPSPSNNSLDVKITLGGGTSNTRAAHVDHITLNYERTIEVPAQGALYFVTASRNIKIAGTDDNTVVLDVTDPARIMRVALTPTNDNGSSFTSAKTGEREYIVFNKSGSGFATPTYVSDIANQDLHSSSGADLIIFTTTQAEQSARKLGAYRQNSSDLTVEVINHNNVYNEFSSGTPDVNALRKYLKMLYDRANSGKGILPRYVLLMGRPTFDHRHLTASLTGVTYESLPTWQTDEGLNDNTTYQTDDIIGFLNDYSGVSPGTDTLSVAIGRIPSTTAASAAVFVDKIIDYETSSPQGAWRSKAVFIADDDNNSAHMRQTESTIEQLSKSNGGERMLVEKIYIDAYDYINGVAVEGRNEFNRQLDEGTLWVNYIGHANTTTLSSEGILNYADMGTLFLKKLPFFYAATCDFMRWDGIETSGAEMLAATQGGGVIGAISASRPVYINQNGLLNTQMGRFMGARSETGRNFTVGEILQKAKNAVKNDENKLRFSLLGDPSMRLLLPERSLVIDSMAGTPYPATDGEQHIIEARQDLTVTGYITAAGGEDIDNDYSGIVSSTIYDALESVTTQGHGATGEQYTFLKHGMRLFAGNDSIVNGRFTLHIAMPAEVADNFEPATITLYATDKNGDDGAVTDSRFYVYGTDENAVEDTIAPSIDAMYLNYPAFVNGGITNASPTLIAEISDNHAINMSMAGIGHWMTLTLDGIKTYSDVSNYYEPASLQSGTLYYPLNDLENGAHTLTLRVWDASGNSATRSIDFFVDRSAPLQIYDIYVDQSPASETASFYLIHDRPDAHLKVEFMVYDLMGRAIWINTTTGHADRYTSFPITWNLTDRGGHRVQRGIYLYRAVVTDIGSTETSGSQSATPTKKLAVTSR